MQFITKTYIPATLTMLVNLVYGLAYLSSGSDETLVFQTCSGLFGCFAYLHFILVLKWMKEC